MESWTVLPKGIKVQLCLKDPTYGTVGHAKVMTPLMWPVMDVKNMTGGPTAGTRAPKLQAPLPSEMGVEHPIFGSGSVCVAVPVLME